MLPTHCPNRPAPLTLGIVAATPLPGTPMKPVLAAPGGRNWEVPASIH